jgi:hypothetical protein
MKDKVYEAARNRLIPFAEKYADANAGPKPGKKGAKRDSTEQAKLVDWGTKWNLLFHGEMDRLVTEHGIRRTV